MDSLLRKKDMGLPHKHGNGLKVTCTVTGLFCESSFAGLTVVCVRVDSRFRGNDSVGEGIAFKKLCACAATQPTVFVISFVSVTE